MTNNWKQWDCLTGIFVGFKSFVLFSNIFHAENLLSTLLSSILCVNEINVAVMSVLLSRVAFPASPQPEIRLAQIPLQCRGLTHSGLPIQTQDEVNMWTFNSTSRFICSVQQLVYAYLGTRDLISVSFQIWNSKRKTTWKIKETTVFTQNMSWLS